MNVHTAIKLPSTPDEFLHWNKDRDGKREFVEGRIIEMMNNVSLAHALLASRVLFQIMRQIDGARFVAVSADFAMKTNRGIRYPDIFLMNLPENLKMLSTEQPLLIAEILSPTTMASDFGAKALEYQAFDSLKHYLILAQDECRLWLWSRGDDGSWAEPVVLETGEVELSAFGISIDLAALYAGIA
jgi:Uma2 family endonuclease